MNFDYQGYPIRFIQRAKCNDESAHLFTDIFKFFPPVTKYHYIIRAEYHRHDVFAVKFYCKKDRKSDFKYSKIVNKGDLGNVIITCATIIPLLLETFPTASFCFSGARSVDAKNRTIEDYKETQRYKLYAYFMPVKFGLVTFEHFAYDEISGYMLYNRKSAYAPEVIEQMFAETYDSLFDLGV